MRVVSIIVRRVHHTYIRITHRYTHLQMISPSAKSQSQKSLWIVWWNCVGAILIAKSLRFQSRCASGFVYVFVQSRRWSRQQAKCSRIMRKAKWIFMVDVFAMCTRTGASRAFSIIWFYFACARVWVGAFDVRRSFHLFFRIWRNINYNEQTSSEHSLSVTE